MPRKQPGRRNAGGPGRGAGGPSRGRSGGGRGGKSISKKKMFGGLRKPAGGAGRGKAPKIIRKAQPVKVSVDSMIDDEQIPDGKVRLQKYLASAGLGSRRKCEELIQSGRISIDGDPVTEMGVKVDPATQSIEFDGERLKRQTLTYYIFNKPKGVLCTNSDPGGRQRVVDYFPPNGPRLFPVGRLDEDSEGLLLVTNDGNWGNKLAHPRYRIYRTYLVQVAGHPTDETLQQLIKGMFFTEGKFRFHLVERKKKQGRSSFLEVTLAEGKNREVRRLFARVGHKVMKLLRVGFGPLKLGRLKTGEYRPLTPIEMQMIADLWGKARAQPVNEETKPEGFKTITLFNKSDEENKSDSDKPSRKGKKDEGKKFGKIKGMVVDADYDEDEELVFKDFVKNAEEPTDEDLAYQAEDDLSIPAEQAMEVELAEEEFSEADFGEAYSEEDYFDDDAGVESENAEESAEEAPKKKKEKKGKKKSKKEDAESEEPEVVSKFDDSAEPENINTEMGISEEEAPELDEMYQDEMFFFAGETDGDEEDAEVMEGEEEFLSAEEFEEQVEEEQPPRRGRGDRGPRDDRGRGGPRGDRGNRGGPREFNDNRERRGGGRDEFRGGGRGERSRDDRGGPRGGFRDRREGGFQDGPPRRGRGERSGNRGRFSSDEFQTQERAGGYRGRRDDRSEDSGPPRRGRGERTGGRPGGTGRFSRDDGNRGEFRERRPYGERGGRFNRGDDQGERRGGYGRRGEEQGERRGGRFNRGEEQGERRGRFGEDRAPGRRGGFGDRAPRGRGEGFGDRAPRGRGEGFGDRAPRGRGEGFGDRKPRGRGEGFGDRREGFRGRGRFEENREGGRSRGDQGSDPHFFGERQEKPLFKRKPNMRRKKKDQE